MEICFCRNSCPCVINPSENSPELEEIKRINREYQVKAFLIIHFYERGSLCHFPYFYNLLLFSSGWGPLSYFWRSLWRKRRLRCCTSTLFTQFLYPSYWSKLHRQMYQNKHPNHIMQPYWKSDLFNRRGRLTQASSLSTASISVSKLMLRWPLPSGITWWVMGSNRANWSSVCKCFFKLVFYQISLSVSTVGACRQETSLQQLHIWSLQDSLSLWGICGDLWKSNSCY